jgi:hypothetical protein
VPREYSGMQGFFKTEVQTAMKIHTIDFRVITPFCSLSGGYQCFGGTHCLYLHDRSWTQYVLLRNVCQTTTQCHMNHRRLENVRDTAQDC